MLLRPKVCVQPVVIGDHGRRPAARLAGDRRSPMLQGATRPRGVIIAMALNEESERSRSGFAGGGAGWDPGLEIEVPFEQRPVNEYSALKDGTLYSWAELSPGSFFVRLGGLWLVTFTVLAAPIAAASFNPSKDPLKFTLAAGIGTLLLVSLVVLRIYLGWSYVGDRLLSAVVPYEETGWYDGQMWVKPPEVLARDRLLGSYKVKPVINLLKQTLVGTGALLVTAVSLFIFSGPVEEFFHTLNEAPSNATPKPSLRGVKKPPMIGREEEEAKLERMLLNPTARFAVMYVVGECGIGKTTLVNTVYAKPTIREHFKSSAIVKVQRNFCLPKIIELICDRFMQKEKPNIAMLRRTLTGQRYLLVIDGRQMTVADWNSVIHVLPKDEAGSRVVLITKKVPTVLDHPNHEVRDIKVEGLDFEGCRKLFNSRLHGDEEDRPDYPESYYEQVHSITGGSPLAIILLSGLMRTKEYPIEWDNVFKYLESIQSKRLDRILSLSFDDLSNELKLCFLYFIAFPQGYKASRNTLVNLWIAEGFLAARDGKTAENVGHIYLSELIARGLVDEVAEDDTCRMSKSMALHSRVSVFALSEARESNFMEMHDGDYIPAPATVRRLTLQNDMDRYAALTSPVPKLRSIIGIFQEEKRAPSDERPTPLCTDRYSRKRNSYMPKSKFDMVNLLEGSKFLRVIKLQGVEIGAELPKAIGNMVHLRYLAVCCSSLTTIPASIGKLTNLETLDVRHSSVRELPRAFWYITSLRHVTGFKLAMPRHVGILKHIQTLSSIRTSEDWEGHNLANVVHLKTLNVIVEGEHQKESAKALLDNLNKLDYLTTLVIEGTGLPMSIFTGPSLHRLQTLRLTRTVMHSLPPLTQDDGHGFQLPNLRRLSLTRTSLPEGFIEKLAELPLLTELELKEISYQGEVLVFRRNGFESLRKLEIDNAPKSISIEEFALPMLKSMQVFGCTDDIQLNIHPDHQIEGKVKWGENEVQL